MKPSIDLFAKDYFRKHKYSDNHMEVDFRDGEFYFTIENPWAGDTYSGFGQETSVNLEQKEAIELMEFLKFHLTRRRK